MNFSLQIKFSFPTRPSSFKYILKKKSLFVFWTSLINFLILFWVLQTLYYFSNFFRLYIFIFFSFISIWGGNKKWVTTTRKTWGCNILFNSANKEIFSVLSIPVIMWQVTTVTVKKKALPPFVRVNALLFFMQYVHASFPCVLQPESMP